MSRVASLDEDPTIAAIHGPSKTKHPGSASSNFNISRSQAYNHLYGLSQVGTDDNKTPCPPTVYNMEGNGYIDVLNSLAFLLVSQPGEKAAATAYISPPILKLLWAKNANATPGDVDYVNKIVQDASRQACSVDITRAVLPVCKTQIRQHAMALLRAFGPIENETNLWGWERRRPSHRYIRDELIKSGIVVRGWSFIRCLDNFLHSIEEFKYQSDERLVSLLIFASALSHSDGIRDLVQSERLDLLRQLGRYHGSVENILSGARAFRSRGLKIQAELIANPSVNSPQVHSETVAALSYGLVAPRPNITFEDVSAHFESTLPGVCPNRSITLTCVQHPVITVCIPMLQRHIGTIYLGMSDYSCCQWCEDWLLIALLTTGVWNYHYTSWGNVPNDWRIPKGAPYGITGAMIQYLKKKAERILVQSAKERPRKLLPGELVW